MEAFAELIRPELLAMVPALNFAGQVLKKSRWVRDEQIPAVLGALGVLLASGWQLAAAPPADPAGVGQLVFTGVTQGLLCAAGAVYAHQLVHQPQKEKEQAAGEK